MVFFNPLLRNEAFIGALGSRCWIACLVTNPEACGIRQWITTFSGGVWDPPTTDFSKGVWDPPTTDQSKGVWDPLMG